jgi:LasA protease
MRPTLHVAMAAAGATALALSTAVLGTPAMGAPTPAAPTDLVGTVTTHLLGQTVSGAPAAQGRQPVVNVSRQAGGWAFGTAVLAGQPGSEQYPYGWLFLAQRERGTAGGWRLGFEGEAAFAELAVAAPAAVASPAERELFATHGANPGTEQAGGDYRTGMRLPFATGVSWSLTGGPHGWAGSDLPYSSLDISGGDQIVRAARGGTAYTMCQGWLRVFHDRGYATDYYHLWNNINVNGAAVGEGAFLGNTGTDVTCGGSANGRHVHFALRQNGVYVGAGGHNYGKWVPIAGSAPYQGYALHGSAVTFPGGAVFNYGALGFTQGVIDANGGTLVNKRSGPGTGYAVVGTVADGATVTVSCSANGTTHTGRWGATSLWNRLTDGTWVTDAFMWTGISGAVNGFC